MIHPTTLYTMATSHNDELQGEARAARLAREAGHARPGHGRLELKSVKVAALTSLLLAATVLLLA
ncbi:hypothetical protein BH24CHL6_BH24CHL6_07660 [soil metagenome]